MSSTTLALSNVVNVSVVVSPIAAAAPTFNQGLIVGPSTVIPSSGANSRVRTYTSLAGMSADGFSSSNPEFLAAQLYFGQTPAPQTLIVGRQDLTASETALTALQACRAANPNWWACMVTDAVTADHEAIAAWIQAASPVGAYFYVTSDSAVVAGTAGNVMLTLQAATYTRSLGIYSTTQSGAFPNNVYAAAAAMGVAMGLNSGLANSNFTLKFRQLVGVGPEPLTQTQVNLIENANGNVYVGTANSYTWLEQGTVASGQYLDIILGIDMLASDIQYSLANELISVPSVPRDDAGEAQLLAVVEAACDRAVTRGFLAPGVWSGQQVLNLLPGTPLPSGYSVQAQSFTKQSASDKAARKAMPIYASVITAGSIHSITIGVYVQN